MKRSILSVLMLAMFSSATVSAYSVLNVYPEVTATDVEEDPIVAALVSRSDVEFTLIKNDATYPWTVEDGYIQNGNGDINIENSTSIIDFSFSINTPSVFSFERQVTQSSHDFVTMINGKDVFVDNKSTAGSWTKAKLCLSPGDYVIRWYDVKHTTSKGTYSKIRNVELYSADWLEIDLATPGTLGVEVLYKVDVLADVEFLKVKGTINDADWTNIKQMTNLVGLDLSEAQCSSVPNSLFDGHGALSHVTLPEGLTSIGEYAFRGTNIVELNIPSTVKTIGNYAFSKTRLTQIGFPQSSNLTTIGDYAFYQSQFLREVVFPDALTSLGEYAFYECVRLSKLHFSKNLNNIQAYCCYNCSALNDLLLPTKLRDIGEYAFYQTRSLKKLQLPEDLYKIRWYAFAYCGVDSVYLPVSMSQLHAYAFLSCPNLAYVELPVWLSDNTASSGYSSSYGYDQNFKGCNSLKTVVCKSATPPSIKSDPFISCPSKTNITLKVPAFAVANYKLDTYWYQFGNIEEIDTELDYWKIAGDLSLTNSRRMGGKPDLDLYFGGKMTVGGNAPMETANFNWFVNESNPGCLLNHTADFTAETLSTQYQVEANKWYFLTPVFDVDLTQVKHSANASFVFRYYDAENRALNGTGNSWKDVSEGVLKAGQGYIFQCNAAGTVTLPAGTTGVAQMFNTTDVSVPLAVHDATASANKNWNYVGNPYPTYYDVYYMDFTAPVTVWTGSTYKAYSIVDDEFVLRPMQAFFVQKPDAVDNIIFHKEGRQLNSTVNRASYAKAQNTDNLAERHFFDLKISSEDGLADETRIVINENAAKEYDLRIDASKFLSMKKETPQIFTSDANGIGYAINERPLEYGIVPLAYCVGKDGFYEIQALRTDGEVLLYDNLLKKTIDLSAQSYTFYSASTPSVDNSRFSLQIKVNTEATGLEYVSTAGTVSVESGNGMIEIKGATGGIYEIYTMDAKVVKNGVANGKTIVKLPAGSYLVKVLNNTYKAIVY